MISTYRKNERALSDHWQQASRTTLGPSFGAHMKSNWTLGFKRFGNPRGLRMKRVITAIALWLALTALVAPAPAQDKRSDVIFRDLYLDSAIAMLANSLQKSVAFDREIPTQRKITFEALNVLTSEALAQLLRRERLYLIELGSVLIVAPDSEESRANYTPQRIAVCRIDGDEDPRRDIVLPPAPLQHGLETLAKAMKREATVDAAIAQESRAYGFKLRNVTTAEAMQALCLVAHVAVREEGRVLAFTANAAP